MLHLTRKFSSTNAACSSSFKLAKDYRLKCGLEIHSQLNTKHKLFSLSENSFNETPNSKISYFDFALPGTQPKINPESVLLALRAAVALSSDLQPVSRFDRKHYFYGDQPLGYQITQHYAPYAKNGSLKLTKEFDDINEDEKIIRIGQIQLEQDTGKSMYIDHNKFSKVDLNRANIPLIEMVSRPDFTNVKQVKAFVKKYQVLLRHLKVCTGDLETGAMRVDVNISVNGGERVEIKNLASISAISNAIQFEYKRQIDLIQQNKPTSQETRGWNGSETIKLRSKETATDYRYMPDPEIPPIYLDENMYNSIKASLPELPDEISVKLLKSPHKLRLKDVKFLTNDPVLLTYYLKLFELTHSNQNIPAKIPANWLLHELIGSFTKMELPFNPQLFPATKLAELICLIHNKSITNVSAKLLLNHILSFPEDSKKEFSELISEFDLAPPTESDAETQEAIIVLCKEVIENFPVITDELRQGKNPNAINFLLGQVMRSSNGKIKSDLIKSNLKKLMNLA